MLSIIILVTVCGWCLRWSGFLWQGIACQQLDEHEYWLVADLGSRCSNDGVSPYRALCLALGLAFPVGLPLAFLAMMRSQRVKLQTAGSKERERFLFFIKDYEPEYYWWEILEMLRKVRHAARALQLKRALSKTSSLQHGQT